MTTIWKFELDVTDVQKVAMPAGAELLHAAGQHVEESGASFARSETVPMLWARIDADAPVVHRLIRIAGTGHPCPDGQYIGSAICGPFVWHVFDGGEVA